MAKTETKGLKVCRTDSHLLQFKELLVYSCSLTDMYLNLNACL